MINLSVIPILLNFSLYPFTADPTWNHQRIQNHTDSNTSNNPIDESFYKLKGKEITQRKKITWEKVIENDIPRKKIKWELDYSDDSYDDFKYPKSYKEKVDLIRNSEKVRTNEVVLGESVPTANTIKSGDINFSFNQKSTIKGSYGASGTGNQNYSSSAYYGINNRLTLGIFYTHSDDPLHREINNKSSPIANRWISYGSSLSWQAFKNKNTKIALIGSVENWNVKSGGCNLYKCTSNSSNIFNSSTNSVENDNLVGSFSLPISWNITKSLQFTITPRAIFLPSTQGNSQGSGDFYGNNIGFGTGFEYKPFSRLKFYSSTFIPIGPGYNSFDQNLNFTRKNIFTYGLHFYLDDKISFEGSLTNSFGLTPSTSILTIPSENEILYGLKLVYRPTNNDWGSIEGSRKREAIMDGLSVSSAGIIREKKQKLKLTYSDKETWSYNHIWGISELFNADLSISKISQNIATTNPLEGKYHALEKVYIRGGGKAMIFSQDKGDYITTSFRFSAGRLMGNGWVFGEMLNTYKVNNSISFNINPKVSISGVSNPAGIGTSLNWRITDKIALIPETNINLKGSQSNWTIALRLSRSMNNYIDFYTTNSLSFVDTGQLIKAKDQSFGINIATII